MADPRYDAEVELLAEKQKLRPADARPSHEQFTAEVEALYDLSDDIRLLIRALTKAELEFRARPETALDRIGRRRKTIGLAKIAEITGQEVS